MISIMPESIHSFHAHHRLLCIVVAMESALADGRYDEAAKLRDEYRRSVAEGALQSQKNAADR